MLHLNPVSAKKSFTKKAVSLLRYPLFTISFPIPAQKKYKIKKKPELPNPKKVEKQIQTNIPNKSIPDTNKHSSKKSVPYIFSPIRNKEVYDKLLFVIKALDKSGTTAFTNVLHIENTNNGSKLIATDGKRMHVTEIKTRIRPGNYKPIISKDKIKLRKAAVNINYPNWERVVPVNVTRRGCIAISNAFINENSGIYKSIIKMTGEKLNPKYLADLAINTWEIYCQSEKRKAVLLKQYGIKETYAVIMPLS